jgi:hypothetical protein
MRTYELTGTAEETSVNDELGAGQHSWMPSYATSGW